MACLQGFQRTGSVTRNGGHWGITTVSLLVSTGGDEWNRKHVKRSEDRAIPRGGTATFLPQSYDSASSNQSVCQPNPLQQTGYLQTIHHLSHKTLILKAIWYGLTLFITLVSDSQKAQNWLQRFLCYGNDKSEIMSLRSRFLNIQPFVNVKWNFSSYRYCTWCVLEGTQKINNSLEWASADGYIYICATSAYAIIWGCLVSKEITSQLMWHYLTNVLSHSMHILEVLTQFWWQLESHTTMCHYVRATLLVLWGSLSPRQQSCHHHFQLLQFQTFNLKSQCHSMSTNPRPRGTLNKFTEMELNHKRMGWWAKL